MTYAAFISYSHAADGRLAPNLQSGLQHICRPWYRRRALRLFRDKTSLSASPSLWSAIEKALDASQHFILLASPEAAASEWVRKEVEHWLARKPASTILIVLTDGTLLWEHDQGDFDWNRTDALPDNLRRVFADEPLHVDLRWVRREEQVSLDHPRFLDAVADLAAPLHGRDKDDIVGEDIRQHKRTKLMAWSTITGLVLLAAAAVLAAYQALQERDLKERQRQAARSGRLVAESRFALEDTRYDQALLLGVEATRGVDGRPTLQSRMALFRTLLSKPGLITYVRGPAGATDACFSPDGKSLATSHGDGSVILWDVESRRQIRRLQRPPAQIERANRFGARDFLSFGSEGRTLALAGGTGIVVWEVGSGQRLRELNAGEKEIFSEVAVTGDHRTAAVISPIGYTGKAVRLWDLSTGEPKGESLRHEEYISTLAFGGLDRLLVGHGGGSITVWDLAKQRRIGKPLKAQRGPISHLVLALEKTHQPMLVSSSSAGGASAFSKEKWDAEIIFWDWASRKSFGAVPISRAARVRDIAVTGGLLATAEEDGEIRLWDTRQGKPIGEPLKESAERIALSPVPRPPGGWTILNDRDRQVAELERRVKVASVSGDVLLWDAAGQTSVGGKEMPKPPDFSARPITLASDGQTAVLDTSLTLVFWDILNAEQIGEIKKEAFNPSLFSSAISLDGQTLASSTSSRFGPVQTKPEEAVLVWNTAFGEKRLEGFADLIFSLALSPNGQTLATGAKDGGVALWDVQTRKPILGPPSLGGDSPASALAFSHDGRILAIGSTVDSKGGIRLWDMQARELIRKISVQLSGGHLKPKVKAGFGSAPNAANGLVFSPDGRLLAAAFRNGTMMLFDMDSGDPLYEPFNVDAVSIVKPSLAFSPDSSVLVVGTNGMKSGSVQLWDVESGRPLGRPLLKHDKGIVGVAFSPDGELLTALDSGGQATVWGMGLVWEKAACAIANRNLTCREWRRHMGDERYRKTCPELPGPAERC